MDFRLLDTFGAVERLPEYDDHPEYDPQAARRVWRKVQVAGRFREAAGSVSCVRASKPGMTYLALGWRESQCGGVWAPAGSSTDGSCQTRP